MCCVDEGTYIEVINEKNKEIGSAVKDIVKSNKINFHLIQYSNKNKMDYFIHKTIGDFLIKELDFYIKNEIIDMDELLVNDDKNILLLKNNIPA